MRLYGCMDLLAADEDWQHPADLCIPTAAQQDVAQRACMWQSAQRSAACCLIEHIHPNARPSRTSFLSSSVAAWICWAELGTDNRQQTVVPGQAYRHVLHRGHVGVQLIFGTGQPHEGTLQHICGYLPGVGKNQQHAACLSGSPTCMPCVQELSVRKHGCMDLLVADEH